VPASVASSSSTKTAARHATHFPCQESQGLVWVWPRGEPDGAPYVIPGVNTPGYEILEYDASFDATLYSTAENILDVPHTGFLHKGLFRGASRRHRVTVRVTRSQDRAEAEFIGEPRPEGVIGRLLAPRGGALTHVDRFIMPGIAQVEYALGEQSHVVVTNVLSPVSEFKTRMFTVVALRLPLATSLVARVAEPIARRIVDQDARILKEQTRTTQEFGGEQFVSTEVDVLGSSILKLLRWGEQGSIPDVPPEVREVEMEI
ncbi:MAG: aromatic ring-hydroxylating dioxygenase subunit alpha, partial [Myxococcota bacterium]